MIDAVTEKNKENIGNGINSAKSAALKDINNEYDAILKDLKKYYKTKEDLENETKNSYRSMNKEKLTGEEIKDTMNKVIAQHTKIEQDIIISRASVTQTQV